MYAEEPCVDDKPDKAESDESPERSEEIDDREEIVDASVEESAEELVSETPSSAESVSKPVVFESPKSAVAVSPVPTVLLDVFFSLLLPVVSLVFAVPESEGIETDGIEGEEISGIEIEGILVCAKTAPRRVLAINRRNTHIFGGMRLRNFRMILQVRKTFIDHFQSGSKLRNCFFQSGLFFLKPGLNINFL